MTACCVGPLAGVAILGAFGINIAFLAALACPLMMGYMIWMMGRMQSPPGQSSEETKPLSVGTDWKPAPGEVQSSGERKIDEVPAMVMTEIKPVPVDLDGMKGEKE